MGRMSDWQLEHSLRIRGFSPYLMLTSSRGGAYSFAISEWYSSVLHTLFGAEWTHVLECAVKDLEESKVDITDRRKCAFYIIEWVKDREYRKHHFEVVPPPFPVQVA